MCLLHAHETRTSQQGVGNSIKAEDAIAWRKEQTEEDAQDKDTVPDLLSRGDDPGSCPPPSIYFDSELNNVTDGINPIGLDRYLKAQCDNIHEAVEYLRKELETKWVDVLLGKTGEGECTPPTPGHIQVELKTLRRPMGRTVDSDGNPLPEILGHVIHIKRGLSPLFVARTMISTTQSSFVPSTNIGTSSKKRLYRIVVADEEKRHGDRFKLSNDEIPIGATASNVTEQVAFDMTGLLFQIIDGYVLKGIKDEEGKHHVRWCTNRSMCQSVLNFLKGVYGKHDDGSFHHCHEGMEPDMPVRWPNGDGNGGGSSIDGTKCPEFYCLPHKKIMRVATLVMTSEDSDEVTSILKHWLKTSGEELSSVELCGSDIHLQLFGVQWYTQHGVLTTGENEWIRHLAMSIRQSMGPSDGYAFWKALSRANVTEATHSDYTGTPGNITLTGKALEAYDKESFDRPVSRIIKQFRAISSSAGCLGHDSQASNSSSLSSNHQGSTGRSLSVSVGQAVAPDPIPMAAFHKQIKDPELASMFTVGQRSHKYDLARLFGMNEFLTEWRKKGIYLRVRHVIGKQKRKATKQRTNKKKRRKRERNADSSDSDRDEDDAGVSAGAGIDESNDASACAEEPERRLDDAVFDFGVPPFLQPYKNPVGTDPEQRMDRDVRLVAGDVLPKAYVKEKLRIPTTDHYKAAWRYGDTRSFITMNAFVIEIMSKNDFPTIFEMLDKLKVDSEWKRDKANRAEVLAVIQEALVATFVCDSGGAKEQIGSHAQDLNTMDSKHGASVGGIADDQDPQLPQNVTTSNAAQRNPVVTLFAPWELPANVARDHPLRETPMVMFIGMFVLEGKYKHRDDKATVEQLKQSPRLKDTEKEVLGFRAFNHFQNRLIPYGDPKDIYFPSYNLHPLEIADSGIPPYIMRIPPANGTPTREDLVEHFFSEGEWEKFSPTKGGDTDMGLAANNEPEQENREGSELQVDIHKLCQRNRISVSERDMMSYCCRVSAANAMRALRMNVIDSPDGDHEDIGYLVTPIVQEKLRHFLGREEDDAYDDESRQQLEESVKRILDELGVVPQTTPQHCPLRSLDATCTYLLMLCGQTFTSNEAAAGANAAGATTSTTTADATTNSDAVLPNEQQPLQYFEDNPDEFERLLLTSMVFRFLGNMEALSWFIRKGRDGADGTDALMDKESVDHLTNIINDRCFTGKGRKALVDKNFLTPQYTSSLPEYRWNSIYCQEVIAHFADSAGQLARRLLSMTQQEDKRHTFFNAVMEIKKVCGQPLRTEKERNRIGFPALQVMLDLDLIVKGRQWGDMTTAVYFFKGYGGNQGISVFCNDRTGKSKSNSDSDGAGPSDETTVGDELAAAAQLLMGLQLQGNKGSGDANCNADGNADQDADPDSGRDNADSDAGCDDAGRNVDCDDAGRDADDELKKLETEEITMSNYKEKLKLMGMSLEDMGQMKPWYRTDSPKEWAFKLCLWMHYHLFQATEQELALISLERIIDPDTNMPIVREKGRDYPLCAMHFEHEGCGMYFGVSRSIGTRSHTAPAPARAYCHPTPSPDLFNSRARDLFMNIVSVWVAVALMSKEEREQLVPPLADIYRPWQEIINRSQAT